MRTGTEAPSVPVRLSADGGTGRKTAEISSKNVRIFLRQRDAIWEKNDCIFDKKGV
mgnify:CR=1 FL=1